MFPEGVLAGLASALESRSNFRGSPNLSAVIPSFSFFALVVWKPWCPAEADMLLLEEEGPLAPSFLALEANEPPLLLLLVRLGL